MGRFTNKFVVIAGGTSGIGRAAAREFIREGRHTTYAAPALSKFSTFESNHGQQRRVCYRIPDYSVRLLTLSS
jgi:NAD(P)-dependent dehydrogenase (short-subunit alcohol dehydrogenase family)